MPGNPTSNPPENASTAAAPSRASAAILGPGIPGNTEGPVFREPWEAQAFAMTLALTAGGAFTWGEWTVALGEEIRQAQAAGDPDTGETYFRHWLAALERLVARKGIATAGTLARYRDAWARATDRTPHGSPIELLSEDFSHRLDD